jgi:nitrile hydratase accessory protein
MDQEEILTTFSSAKIPEQADEPQFDAPWQARAFSVVVAMHQQGVFEWNEFQSRLIEKVQNNDHGGEMSKAVYYRQWMAAFQQLIIDKEICELEEIKQRTTEFQSGKRDASEFVVGATDH